MALFWVFALSTFAIGVLIMLNAPGGYFMLGVMIPLTLMASLMAGITALRVRWWVDYRMNREGYRETAKLHLKQSVDQHRGALAKNLASAIKTNDYGKVVDERTHAVLSEFFESIQLGLGALSFSKARTITLDLIKQYADQDRASGFRPEAAPKNGLEFEHWVAASLRSFGWEAMVTAGSGDQGIDVICTKGQFRLGLQCKVHAEKIGNKAVQEAGAGRAFHRLEYAGVLATSSFTPSAEALAQSTGVFLFSHYDIPILEEKLRTKLLAVSDQYG